MKILLIRHGETTGDTEDRYGGSYDDHLTEKGKDQLNMTAQKLLGMKVDKIFTSTLIRAKESTEIINEVLQTEVVEMPGLKERNYGVLGGLTRVEALKKYPKAVEDHKDPANTDPEGEPQIDFINRVTKAFEEISIQKLGTVAVVAHGGSLKVILKHLSQPIPGSIGDGEIIEVNI